jgi:Xaa-Pro aminopeptidase
MRYAASSICGWKSQAALALSDAEAELVAINDTLTALQIIKTQIEIARIKASCEVRTRAYAQARMVVRAGATEMEIAASVRKSLMECDDPHTWCDGYAFCMSGPYAAESYKFFKHTRRRSLKSGDLALVHCNSPDIGPT